MKVSTYQMYSSNGRPIRKATQVTLPDGRTVQFTERIPYWQAVIQAEAFAAKYPPTQADIQCSMVS